MRLIDADALINIFETIDVEIIPYADIRGYVQVAIDHIRKELDAQPTIDAVERKHGEWIPFMIGTAQWGHQCSLCGKNGVGIEQYNFCPSCGADMREREGE